MSLSDIVTEEQATACIRTVDIITRMSDYRRMFGSGIGYIDHLKITPSHTKSFVSAVSSPVVPW
jgi:hypothetical protein